MMGRTFASETMMLSRNCSALLPTDARKTLVLASHECKAFKDDEKRAAHLERAIDEVKNRYPTYFRQGA